MRPAPNPPGVSCRSCAELADPLDPLTHRDWAVRIARKVSIGYGFRAGSAEDQDVAAEAMAAVVRLLTRPHDPGERAHFRPEDVPPGGDLSDAFRGYAAREVRTRCVREAERIRGGGLFHTRRFGPAVTAAPLGDSAESIAAAEPDDDEPDRNFVREDAPHASPPAPHLSPRTHLYGRTFGRRKA